MKHIFHGLLIFALLMAASCSGQKKQAPAPKTYEPERVVDESISPTSPSPPAQSREIDLGIEGGEYGNVEIDKADENPPPFQEPNDDGLDYSCEKAEDCAGRGLPRQKRPGQWYCVEDTCVMKYDDSAPETL